MDSVDEASPTSNGVASSASPDTVKTVLDFKTRVLEKMTTLDHFHSSDLYLAQGISVLIDYMTPPTQTSAQHMSIGAWLCYLPGRPVLSRELQCGLRSHIAHQIGKATKDERMLHYGRYEYVQALSMLQRSLQCSKSWDASDTLCSAILLGLYELFVGTTSSQAWMKHAAGIGQLLQARGPQAYRTEFDSCLLKSIRGIIIMDALFSGKNCFLAEPNWQAVTKTRYDGKDVDEMYELLEDFNCYLSRCPALVRTGYAMKQGAPVNPVEVLDLSIKANQLYTELLAWYERFARIAGLPIEEPSSQGDDVYPIIYWYDDLPLGAVFTNYWACILIMQDILTTCQYQDYLSEMETTADNICKSVECLGEGTWGAYRLSFSLRIAFEVPNVTRRKWIMGVLQRFQKTYAATDPKSYPSVEEGV